MGEVHVNQYCYNYPRPMVTTDVVLFTQSSKSLDIVLIERLNDPYKKCWALPGGFVDMDEDLLDAAHRELTEETGIAVDKLYQMCAIGTPGRDPRGRTITVVYSGFTRGYPNLAGGSDAGDARWFPLDSLPQTAFDHGRIIDTVIRRWITILSLQKVPSGCGADPHTLACLMNCSPKNTAFPAII